MATTPRVAAATVIFDRRQALDQNQVQYRRTPTGLAGDSYSLTTRLRFATGTQASQRTDRTDIKLVYQSAADPVTQGRTVDVARLEFAFHDTVSVTQRKEFIALLAAYLGDPEKRDEIATMTLPGGKSGTMTIDGTKVSSDSNQVVEA